MLTHSGFRSGINTDNPTIRKMILLSSDPNIINILLMVPISYSPKNDLSRPIIIRNDVATIPKPIPILSARDPAVVG